MNAEQLTARGTGPSFLFVSHKAPYPIFLDVLKIVDHAHAIFSSIALVQVIQPVARKPVTAETVPDRTLPYLFTVLDQAGDAGFWLDAVVAPATGASILLSCIGDTKAAVHSTGSDHLCSDRTGN